MRMPFTERLGLAIIPRGIALLMNVWFASCRVRVHNEEYFFPPECRDRVILASFWHYSLIYIFYFLRRYSATVMVSSSRDGEYVARLAHTLGFDTVRGSRNSRGVEALKGMIRALRSGQSGAIVADGSQGPPLEAQPGVIMAASRTGVPIIPMAWSASACYTFNSWDRTAIPKPFSRIDFFFGEPLVVPSRLKSDEIENYRRLLEKRLRELYTEAWKLQGRDQH